MSEVQILPPRPIYRLLAQSGERVNYLQLSEYCTDGKSISQIAELTNVSKTTVRYYLKKFNLKTRLSLEYVCSCGVTGQENFHKGRKTLCKKCCNSKRLERNRDRRSFTINLLGGKCRSCGYDQYPCSLEVHHTDPSLKDPNFESMRSWSEARIVQELVTCVFAMF